MNTPERTYGSFRDCGPMNLNMTVVFIAGNMYLCGAVLFVQQLPFCDCSPTLEDRSYSINKFDTIYFM